MKNSKLPLNIAVAEAYKRATFYCAYQERTQQHVRDKLYSFGLYSDQVDELICKLIVNNYINEERYAKAYAGGKFRIKKWGRNKIKANLKFEGISEYCIKIALKEIPFDDYEKTMRIIIDDRLQKEKEKNQLKRKYKVVSYLISRGFETDLVWDLVNANFV